MNISIAPELEQFVQAQIQSGAYMSANEVFGEALHLLAQQEESRLKRIKAMDDFIDEALNSNEFVKPELVWKEVEAINEEAKKRHA